MKDKKQIYEHLSSTYYRKTDRKDILLFLIDFGVIDESDNMPTFSNIKNEKTPFRNKEYFFSWCLSVNDGETEKERLIKDINSILKYISDKDICVKDEVACIIKFLRSKYLI